jgi:hypothetical protein
VGCDDADPACGVPRATRVVVHFDRLLWPEPVPLESIRIYTGVPRNRVGVSSITYDLLEQSVTYELASQLAPRTLYRVELPGLVPGEGPRAFDGGELESASTPLGFSFYTQAAGVPALPPRVPGRIPTCDEVVELLTSHCGSSSCHGGSAPSMGLGLDTRAAFVTTALRKVARQTETAGSVAIPRAHPARFGTAMPIVAPGSAANSYLVYKLLISDRGFPSCDTPGCARFQSPDAPEHCPPLAGAERERLRDWFVRGEPMPPDGPTTSHPDLDCSSFRALVRFVDAGAKCD